jgi:hypothetical protein
MRQWPSIVAVPDVSGRPAEHHSSRIGEPYMTSLRRSTRRIVVATTFAMALLTPAMAFAEPECITETVVKRYYILGYEYWSSEKTTTVCTELVQKA